MGNNPSIYEPDLRAEFDARRKERGLEYLVRLPYFLLLFMTAHLFINIYLLKLSLLKAQNRLSLRRT